MERTIHAALCALSAAAVVLLLACLPETAAARTQHGQRPLLAQGAGYAEPQGSPAVRRVQRRLRMAKESPGPIDGRFGPLTRAAVIRFQAGHRLAVDGIVGPRTSVSLKRAALLLAVGAGYDRPAGSGRVRALQRGLRNLGARPGPADGLFGPRTEAAVLRFQRRQGLPADGQVGAHTRAAIRHELARAQKPGTQSQPQPAPSSTPRLASPVPPHPSAAKTSWWRSLSTAQVLAIAVLVPALVALLLLGVVPYTIRRMRRSRWERKKAREWALDSRAPEPGPAWPPWWPAEGEADPGVLGYVSVRAYGDKRELEDFQAQAEAIASECDRRHLRLVQVVQDKEPLHAERVHRPGLGYALDHIAAGDAQGLVVAELSRMSASALELGQVLEWLSQFRARLIAAAEGLDTGEHAGEVISRVLREVGDWERARIADPPRSLADHRALKRRISRMRSKGLSYGEIAERLNDEGVPAIRGERWRPSSVELTAGEDR
jgi:peptidoglycan hydrolase-like protein with peptidoglycan-binding domain/DNA invertase Pin-like site-specific DNA recombinase